MSVILIIRERVIGDITFYATWDIIVNSVVSILLFVLTQKVTKKSSSAKEFPLSGKGFDA